MKRSQRMTREELALPDGTWQRWECQSCHKGGYVSRVGRDHLGISIVIANQHSRISPKCDALGQKQIAYVSVLIKGAGQ